jgi:two-component system LytT family response regulator
MKVTAVIVDDESHARKMLKMLLSDAEVEVDVVAESDDAKQAVSAIKEHNPDVVFLDIDMPGLSGIELAEMYGDNRSFEIIFITGHKEHAPKAFRVKALDYLMKPVSPRELDEALSRLVDALEARQKPLNLEDNRIALPMLNGLELVDSDDILVFEAERAYTSIKLKNSELKLVSKRLKLFEELLTDRPHFKRVHRSYLVNMNEVNRYAKAESLLVLNGGVEVPISKEHKEEVDSFFNQLRP